jgi:hypothetical protein
MHDQLEAIRDHLTLADVSMTVTPAQIGHILIALNALTDLVESLIPAPAPAPDPLASARHEYAAERRIDAWAAYQREQE